MKKKDLIDKAGVSPTIISKIVKGDAVSLTIISEKFMVNLEQILGFNLY